MRLIIHWSDSRINKKSIQNIKDSENSIVITSYGLIGCDEIQGLEVNRLICDEAHLFRNHNTKLFKNLQKIPSQNKWLMTGTPIQNKMKDLINLFAFIGIVCNKSNIEEKINTHILRRTKQELNLELPNIKRIIKESKVGQLPWNMRLKKY